jgi:hypothetical protein
MFRSRVFAIVLTWIVLWFGTPSLSTAQALHPDIDGATHAAFLRQAARLKTATLALDTSACPDEKAYMERLFSALLRANELTDQNFDLRVECGSASKRRFVESFFMTVHVSADIVHSAQSEDEVMWVMAHELSHILLGHTELLFKKKTQPRDSEFLRRHFNGGPRQREREREADLLGAKLTLVAGYNPFVIESALKNFPEPADSSLILWLEVHTNLLSVHEGHRLRETRVRKALSIPPRANFRCHGPTPFTRHSEVGPGKTPKRPDKIELWSSETPSPAER